MSRRALRRGSAVAAVAAVSAGIAIGVSHVGQPRATAPVLVWSDEFSGQTGSAPDPSSWRAVEGGGGFGNQELECYTNGRTTSVVDGNGYLVISARRSPGHRCAGGTTNDYVSARLTTQALRQFTYGTISMRAKMPTGMGIWPAFWALGENHDVVGWPASGEIDITEVVGLDPLTSHSSIHGPATSGGPYSLTGTVTAPSALSSAFHVYSVTWTEDGLTFSLDSEPFLTITKEQAVRAGGWVFDQPFYLLLNVAVGGTWPGSPTERTAWPQQMVVDYVRVYQDG